MMRVYYYYYFLCFFVAFSNGIRECNLTYSSNNYLINRHSFPNGFIFGAGSSSYQFEGAAQVDGRRPSIWDTFARNHPEKITDHSTGDVAVEFYYRYKEDIALMKEIGLDSFRFSISWSRILPHGKISKGVNQQGVDFYNFLIDELLFNGIQPLVTLFHWDLPQTLEDEYAGFLSPNIVDDFLDYTDFCFQEFGDRVKQWVTLNEPNLFSEYGYANGKHAPGRCSNYVGNCTDGNSGIEPYLVMHHLILSHAAAVKLYRNNYQSFQKGIIGITVESFWMVPKYQTHASKKAALRALDFILGWTLEPIMLGNYPKTMRKLVGHRLPKFTKEQSETIKNSIDFLGLNYYTAHYADNLESPVTTINLSYTTDSRTNETMEKNGILIGESTDVDWLYLYPKGILEILLYIKGKYYNIPPIYITENGIAEYDNEWKPVESFLHDCLRVNFHHQHLVNLLSAIKKGVDVRGYYAWSFLDNFEWAGGYSYRMGITFVDYKNGLKRQLKSSGLWFKELLKKQSKVEGESLMIFPTSFEVEVAK